MKKTILNSALLLGLLFLASCSTNQLTSATPPQMQSLRAAVVEVLSNGQIKGTGAFISEDGLILTASHLFKDDNVKVEIITADDKRYKATLLRRHRAADLALVKIELNGKSVHAFSLAKEMPKPGETIFLYGAALWNPIMLLTGQMANPDDNYCEYPTSNGYMQTAYVNASTPGLVSGGPWFNQAGEIFGVQGGHLLDQGYDAGISMIGQLSSIQKLIASKHSIHTAGIQAWVWPLWTADKKLVDRFPEGTSGLLVNKLFSNSVLKQAGVKQYEVILSCNGKPTQRKADLLSIKNSFAPGDIVSLEVMSKDHKIRTVKLKLADIESGSL